MKKYLQFVPNSELGTFHELHEEDFESTYDLLRQSVDGYIEHIDFLKEFSQKGIDLWINDEGKLLNLRPSIFVQDEAGHLLDCIVGNICFARTNQDGETLPLNDEDIKFIKNQFKKMDFVLTRIGFCRLYTMKN